MRKAELGPCDPEETFVCAVSIGIFKSAPDAGANPPERSI
jgi:hypothetical protein